MTGISSRKVSAPCSAKPDGLSVGKTRCAHFPPPTHRARLRPMDKRLKYLGRRPKANGKAERPKNLRVKITSNGQVSLEETRQRRAKSVCQARRPRRFQC